MIRTTYLALGAAVVLLGAAPAARQPTAALTIRAVRFYGPEGKTRVKAFVEIPYAVLAATEDGPAGRLSFQVAFRVADSTGLTLFRERWPKQAPGSLRRSEASSVEMLDFALAPGRYLLEVVVEDSVSGRRTDAAVELRAFAERPAASDLLLSPLIRAKAPTDSAMPGEFPRGNVLVTGAARLRLTPRRTTAYYLLEAYSERADSGRVLLALLDGSGTVLVRSRPVAVAVEDGGGLLKGQLDLAGLPPGQYTMRATLVLGGRTTEREAPLEMAGGDATPASATTGPAPERRTDPDYFAGMSEAELDEARAPLEYVAGGTDELAGFDGSSPDAKRRILAEFWRRRDPTAGTWENEAREEFYRTLEYANRTFREGGSRAGAGWRSDRGRIYILNGAPDDVLARQRTGEAPPYQVWRYTRGRNRYYIFADRSGFGAFDLIASNALKEPPLPGWTRILGIPAVVDIEHFLGVSLLGSGENR